MKCNSQDNSLLFLKRKGFISDTRVLTIDVDRFEKINNKLTEIAKRDYNYDLDIPFYSVEATERKAIRGHNYHRDNTYKVYRAIPNEEAFTRLDELRVKADEDSTDYSPTDYFVDPDFMGEEIIPNYEEYIIYKENLLRRLNNRLARIESDKKEFSSNKEVLRKLFSTEREIKLRIEGEESTGTKGLIDEISELKDAPPLSKLEYYTEKDLNRLEKLSISENEEDLQEARNIISFYEALGTFDTKMFNPLFTNDDMFDKSGALTLPSDVVKRLSDLKDKAKSYENAIETKEKNTIVATVNNNSKVRKTFQNKEFEYEELFYQGKGLKDLPWIDMFLMDITNGIFSKDGNGVIPQVMMNTIQNSFEKNLVYAKSVETRMNAIQPELEKVLTELGYKIPIPGIKGVSYDLFRAIDENGQLKDSVTQRYSSNFTDLRNKMFYEFDSELKKAREIEDPVAKQIAYSEAFKKRENWYKKNTIVLDIRKIPEITSDPRFQQFNKNFKSEGVEDHVKELKEALGELGYQEEVEKQIKLLRDYDTMLEVIKGDTLLEYEVEGMSQLPKEALDEIEFWEKKNSPFEMLGQFYEGTPITKGKLKLNSSMSYNYSVPRRKQVSIEFEGDQLVAKEKITNTDYYDERFKVIESHPVLKEFHDLMMEVNQKMFDLMPPEVRKKFTANSIPVLKKNFAEILSDKNSSLFQRISNAYRYIIHKIKSMFGMNPEDHISYASIDSITGKPEYQVNSQFLKSNSKGIKNRHLIEMQRLKKAIGMSPTDSIQKYDRFDLRSLNSQTIAIIAENLGVDANIESIRKRLPSEDITSLELSKVIKSSITDQVVQENSFDLPKILKMYSYMTMEYAARQEVLPIVEMMKKHYEEIKAPAVSNVDESIQNASTGKTRLEGARTNAIKQMDSWFERVVLGNYGTKVEFGDTRIKRELKIGATGKKAVDLFSSKIYVSGKIFSPEEKIMRAKLPELQASLEAIISNPNEDPKSQKKAKDILDRIGTIDKKMGKHLSLTAGLDAMFNFVRFRGMGYNVSSYITNFAEGQIANIIIDAKGDYFTPGNIFRATNIVKGSFVKNLSFGKVVTDGARKTRVLMDRYRILQDASNELQKASSKSAFSKFKTISPYEGTKRTEYLNQAPLMIAVLFDNMIQSKSGEMMNVFDAMDEDGMLLEDFRTEENIKNWEEADGDKYNDFASHIKKTIVDAHGDYDTLRGNMAGERVTGRALLMFKKWLPRQLYNRFARPQDDIETGTKGYKGRYLSHTPASGFMHGAIIGFGGLGLLGAGPLGLVIGGAVGGTIAKFWGADTQMNFLQESALVGKELFMNMIKIPVNHLTGKNIIKSDSFNQKIGETALDQRDIKNLRGNIMDMAITMGFVALLLFTKALLWDDDDEETDTRRMAHNLLANRFMQLSSQSAMYTNPVESYKNLVGDVSVLKFFSDVGKLATEAQGFLEGKDTLASGPNAGESKFYNQLEKTVFPGVFKSGLGFESQAQRQFKKSPFDTWFFGDEKVSQTKAKAIRAVYKEELLESGMSVDDINSAINEKFPPKRKEQTYQELLKEYEVK